MTARCPHYNEECNDQESRGCHYIKSITAIMIATVKSLQEYKELRIATNEYYKQTINFLKEMDIHLPEQ